MTFIDKTLLSKIDLRRDLAQQRNERIGRGIVGKYYTEPEQPLFLGNLFFLSYPPHPPLSGRATKKVLFCGFPYVQINVANVAT